MKVSNAVIRTRPAAPTKASGGTGSFAAMLNAGTKSAAQTADERRIKPIRWYNLPAKLTDLKHPIKLNVDNLPEEKRAE